MVCHKCNHILQGSESYCPDCGSPCQKEKEPEAPSVIFSSAERETDSRIFSEDFPPPLHRKPEKKKSKAGLCLLIVLCAVVIGTLAVTGTEILEFTPAIASLFSSPERNDTTPTTALAQYSPDSGVIRPRVNYKTTVAYVTGSTGQALYKGPDSSYGQLDILSSGAEVHIVGGERVDGSWVYVYVPDEDEYGWIDGGFLSSVMNEVSLQEEKETTEITTKPKK